MPNYWIGVLKTFLQIHECKAYKLKYINLFIFHWKRHTYYMWIWTEQFEFKFIFGYKFNFKDSKYPLTSSIILLE
jgi:hypothetical protein